MSSAEPRSGTIEIVAPDGRLERPERRRVAGFRPYAPADGWAPDVLVAPAERRQRRRVKASAILGQRLDVEG